MARTVRLIRCPEGHERETRSRGGLAIKCHECGLTYDPPRWTEVGTKDPDPPAPASPPPAPPAPAGTGPGRKVTRAAATTATPATTPVEPTPPDPADDPTPTPTRRGAKSYRRRRR